MKLEFIMVNYFWYNLNKSIVVN